MLVARLLRLMSSTLEQPVQPVQLVGHWMRPLPKSPAAILLCSCVHTAGVGSRMLVAK